jgi:hypothetical protein
VRMMIQVTGGFFLPPSLPAWSNHHYGTRACPPVQ